MTAAKLPVTNENGCYEIRLESIGGLGANLCGKMLGELGVRYLGLNAASFSSYGSEKTGTPVRGFIRYCAWEREIRVHTGVEAPHLLAVFHAALLGRQNVTDGIDSGTKILINTACSPEEMARAYGFAEENCFCLSAQEIAIATGARINTVMLGGIGSVMGFVEEEQLEKVCADSLGKKYPAALADNLEGIRRGFAEVRACAGRERECVEAEERKKRECVEAEGQKERKCVEAGWRRAEKNGEAKEGNVEGRGKKEVQEWGFLTAPQGGINPRIGNSVTNDLSAARQGYFPLFEKEKCINCAQCDVTCPDMVFQFREGEYRGKRMMVNMGLDYYHCKGCLRCVDICPSGALTSALEADYPGKPYFMPDQRLLRQPFHYEVSGADGYITSEGQIGKIV